MVSFEHVQSKNRANKSVFRPFDYEDNGDEDLDEYFHQPEKKRRLSPHQVQFLEKSFEVDNKLEPERKIQLAKELDLQPRQVAIWFQNRRARWKTKQLEQDYDALQTSYNTLKADYEKLLQEKDMLEAEVHQITEKLHHHHKDNENGSSEVSPQKPAGVVAESASEGEVSKAASFVVCKQEDICSSKSDMLDSDSPHYTDGVHSSLLDKGEASYAFEPEQSELSQDEEDNLSRNFLQPPYIFPKLECGDYSDPAADSSNSIHQVEEQPFWSWAF